MLIAKIFVNDYCIDEVYIQNREHLKDGVYKYEIRHPIIKNKFIIHRRDLGYQPLLIEVLKRIEKENIE